MNPYSHPLPRWIIVVYVVVLLSLTALYAVNTWGLIQKEAFEESCAAQSGQVQPDGQCRLVVKNVSTGSYHIRPLK